MIDARYDDAAERAVTRARMRELGMRTTDGARMREELLAAGVEIPAEDAVEWIGRKRVG